jgi:3-amino-5-hydroxybenzoic acid synthesis related protein
MFKYIIFDFDGVVIDSHDVQIKALKESYEQIVGIGSPPYDEFFKHSGNSLSNIFNILNLPQEMVPIYNAVSINNIGLIKVKEGIVELLDDLKKKNFTCCLCTGKSRHRTIQILEKFCLEKYFKTIICSDDVENPKPHPESLIRIQKELGCDKHNMVMIGDGINDIDAAKQFGIASVAVTWGDTPKEVLCSLMPNLMAETINELKDFLQGGTS